MLICEFVTEVISSTAPVKLRIRHHDNSAISIDSAIGRIAEGSTDYEYLHLQQLGFSYGSGIQNFDWENFWQAASEIEDNFIPVENGTGIVTGSGNSSRGRLPYALHEGNVYFHQPHFNLPSFEVESGTGFGNISRDFNYIPSVNWENGNYGYSIIVTLPTGVWDQWGSIINATDGNDYNDSNNNFWQSMGLEWEQLNPFGNGSNIDYELFDNFNIAASIRLAVVTSDNATFQSGTQPTLIEHIELLPQSQISTFTDDSERYVYAPIKFHSTDYVYDMRANIYNYSMPTFVEEGLEVSGELRINTYDYAGELEIYAYDSGNIGNINQEEFESWYGELDEHSIANYGNLQVQGDSTSPTTITVEQNQIEIQIPFSYVASNVNAGQTDVFTIFIKASQPDFNQYEHPEEAERQWEYYTVQERWDYTETIRIEVLDVNTEAVDVYDAGNILIEHPTDILHHLIYLECGYKGDIDSDSKDLVKASHPDWKMGFSINEQINARDLIKEICNSTKMTPVFSNDMLKFITIEDTYDGRESIQKIKANEVIDYSFSRTPIGDVITQVEVKYQYDYGLGNFNSSTEIFKINDHYLDGAYYLQGDYNTYNDPDENLDSYNYYGFDEDSDGVLNHDNSFLTFESKYIRDEQTANKLAKYLLMQNCNQHNIVELSLPLKYYGLEVGDLINFDKMILDKKIFGEAYVLEESGDMPIRCGQYILPLFIITQVSKGLSGVEITAMQLHHLSDSELGFYRQASTNVYYYHTYPYLGEDNSGLALQVAGDVDGDGAVTILDIVKIAQHIIDLNILSGQQALRADFNEDGVIDVQDVIGAVQEVTGESDVYNATPANNVALSYGNGNVEIETTGQVAGFEMTYRGAIHGVKKLGAGWKIKIGDNKVLIYSMGETELSPLLFTYMGDFEITSCKYANWDGTSGYTNINNLKSDTWNSSSGDFVADGRKYEEVFTESTATRKVKKSII